MPAPDPTPSTESCLRVALPLPLPRLFDYRAPAGTVVTEAIGRRVRVPFGPREHVGVVVAVGPREPDRKSVV